MRIIDLFIRLMNDEKMPKRIRTVSDNKEYTYDKSSSDYLDEKENYLFEEIVNFMDTKNFLNEKVEILKENNRIRRTIKNIKKSNRNVDTKNKIPLFCKLKKVVVVPSPSAIYYCRYGYQFRTEKMCKKMS